MSLEGLHDVHIMEGSVNGIRFEEFVTETLLPILNPFNGTNTRSVVVMDNCAIHHVGPVVHQIDCCTCKAYFSTTILTRLDAIGRIIQPG